MAPRLGWESKTKKNVLLSAEFPDDFFCFILPSLAAKYELLVHYYIT